MKSNLLFYVGSVLIAAIGVIRAFPKGDKLYDFGSFIASGQAAGQGLDPYGVYALTYTEVTTGPDGALAFEHYINLNPPPLLPLFDLLSHFEPFTGFRAWFIFSLACYTATVWLLWRRRDHAVTPLAIVWAFGLVPAWDGLSLGQVYAPLALLTVIAWLLLDGHRYTVAGALLGIVVAAKPNVAVVPALLALGGYPAVAVGAAFSAALASALPTLLYGPQVWPQWLTVMGFASDLGQFGNGSLFGLAGKLGLSWLAVPLAAALLLAVALWALRRPPMADLRGIAFVTSLLASPVAWAGYIIFLLPLFFRQPWRSGLSVPAALLLLPTWLVRLTSRMPLWPFGWLSLTYNAVLLIVLAVLLLQLRKPTGPVMEAAVPSPVEARSA